jgi:phosphomannomutase
MTIKFGTDGWRAIIGKEYTTENLKRATLATAAYIKHHPNAANGVCVGYDTRFNSKKFAETVADIFSSLGVTVYLSDGFLPTPAVSLFVKKKNLACGVMITASHNPPSYNGFKVKADYGGSAHPEQIAEIEKHLLSVDKNYGVKKDETKIHLTDIKKFYRKYLESELNIAAIKKAKLKIGHHAMFGAGQGMVTELLGKKHVHEYHCSEDPTFQGINPEPIPNYIKDYVPVFKKMKLDVAVLNDGDADRIGMMDEKGNYVDSHKIFAVILKYLVEEKKMKGEVARTYALTQVINKICAKHNLICHNLPIGFKHVGKLMTTSNIIMGGEESGGIGITAHLPERDGVYIGLLVLEIMAKRKKSLGKLIQELYDEYGYFTYDRIDAHLTEAEKERAMTLAAKGDFKTIAGMPVTKFENLDGYKYFFETPKPKNSKDKKTKDKNSTPRGGGWLLIRPSGTEPVLRLYCEADSEDAVKKALKFARDLAK